MSTPTAITAPASTRGGKYLTFAMGNEKYGVEILKVREIVGFMPITMVPHIPAFYRGVINLRGQVIPVVDLRAKFSMGPAEHPDQCCIVVAEIRPQGRKLNVGVIVDRVLDVLAIPADRIEDPPSFGSGVANDFIAGVGKIGEGITLLLDIDKVLASDQIVNLSQSPETSQPSAR
jgi:purine-binding chemotaxis protein CheW